MDSPGAILNGLGLLGIIASILLGFALLLIQPFWALLDCLRSRRGGESNSLWLIALFLTWGLGSFVYGLFLTRSRVFRVFTVSSVLLPLAILVAGALSVMKGSPMAWAEFQERERVEAERLMADFRPAVTSDPLAPIPAIDFVHGSMAPRTAALTTSPTGDPSPRRRWTSTPRSGTSPTTPSGIATTRRPRTRSVSSHLQRVSSPRSSLKHVRAIPAGRSGSLSTPSETASSSPTRT